MAAWGVCSMANAFTQGSVSFYLLRFLLGIAEAGLYPGLLLYLTYWFPESYRARHTANFMMAAPLSNILGGPLSTLILELDGTFGLHGWQLLFLIEGLPVCILAFAVFSMLPDAPRDATWLSAEEGPHCLATGP
jgi:ACS family tartrate transporter-like MFS transporter